MLCVLFVVVVGMEQRTKKEIVFMLGKTARGKHEMLATSCVRDFRTRTYVSNGLKQSEREVRISK
jgi:hypothetical protein